MGVDNAVVNTSALWIVNRNGTGLVELANANASNDSSDKLHSYHPMFSPVAQGEYYWVMFTSLRTYGNRLTVTDDFDIGHCINSSFADCRHQQTWVAAIDINGKGDPSHPAFWLPGQDTAMQNIDAEWSLGACKPMGGACEYGFECCGGGCRRVGNKKLCVVPPECSLEQERCQTDLDCCNSMSGALCIGGYCTR
jgi:hypothetical protein